MKRTWHLLLSALLCVLLLAACAKAPTWEEQYDLGVRYLSEGNYEEAILAFTAAIEIDPKRAPAYVGRGDAYVGSASSVELTAESVEFTSAEADYLQAIDLDALVSEVYGKLADLYLAVGDTDRAAAILERGCEATGDESLNRRRQELEPELSAAEEVVWTDPVFERLIREKIGIPAGPVSTRDLDGITRLFICGDTHAFTNEEIQSHAKWRYTHLQENGTNTLQHYYAAGDAEYDTRGAITNVDALPYFRNLRQVSVIANHITDISVLDRMEQLENALFWANDISDLSPLERFPSNSQNEEQFVEIGDAVA